MFSPISLDQIIYFGQDFLDINDQMNKQNRRICKYLLLTINCTLNQCLAVKIIEKIVSESMELLNDTLTVLASQVVFFLVGWVFFVKMLFKDYELHHLLVQLIFCINFTLSCTMFELIIFEIADILDIGSR